MASDNKGSYTQSGFFKSIANKLPYQALDLNAVLAQLNPKYEIFQDTGSRRTEALAKNSIFFDNDYNNTPSGSVVKGGIYNDMVYANIQADKGARILDYKIMAAFAEVTDCLDEICDECINKNDSGEIVKLHFRNIDTLADGDKDKVKAEFQKYVENFNLEKKGWSYFRQLLVEGEVYFEHIIHKNYPEEGILGTVQLPTELIDPIFDNIQNMIIKGYILRKPIFDPSKPNKIEKFEFIPMDKNQITYINSDIWNQDKTFRLPFIENCRRAYRQLSLIEDSIVIYRLVRAPERLVFNVDTGTLPPPKAEAFLRKLIQEYWSKKTYDSSQAGAVQKFNPQSMLDSFWFAKRTGSEGTTVTQLAGGANLGELTDLMYFVNKLYKALKVPTNRLNTDSTFKDGNEILREELKFARFIIRMQQNFANGLKNGFITHLKLKNLLDKYDLKEQNLHIEFNVPTNFYELRENQKLELKVTNFGNLAANPFVSATYAQKKYLGWSDIDIKANREFLRKDKELEWELAQISQGGPDWRNAVAQPAQPGAEGAPGAMPPGAGGGGGASLPPAFGPAAETEPAPGGEQPAGQQPATPIAQPAPTQ